MISKLYSKIKQYLKENKGFLMGLLGFYLVINIPVPYYIHTTGSLININDKVIIEGEYPEQGSLNLSYVAEIKGNVLTYLMSFVFPYWDLIKKEDVCGQTETYKEALYRNQMLLKEANQNAVFLAYQRAGKQITINKQKHYVVYIAKEAKTNLKIKDEIVSVNGEPIVSLFDYQRIVKQAAVGTKLKLVVNNDKGELKKRDIEVINYEGSKITGIYLVTEYDYGTEPKIEFNFKDKESGASGGLMMALSIYNKLIKTDLTKGKTIVGTGTIDSLGNVGEISGVKYKLKGAVKNKADIFLVPALNYGEALAIKEKKGYNIDIISISTFVDALNYLIELKEE